jgi:RNA polymerase-associated protein RTF1
MTDKMLKLQFGKNERIFPIRLISDNKADESDVSLYVTEMKNQRQQVLSRNEANKIHRKQDELVKNYTYTTEDIENNLRNRKKKGQTAANLGLEQTRAAIAVQVARATLKDTKHQAESGEGDSSAIVEAEKLLQERLDEESLVLKKVKSRKDRLTQRGKDKKWAKVNQRALEMNQKLDRGALKDKDSEKKDKESGAKPKFNPYARRKVKPKILWEVGQKEDKEEETKEAEAPKEGGKQKEQDATPNLVQEHQEKAAALSQSHQFAIDEEILAQSSFTNGITGLSTKKPVRKRVRKGLSLNQYLKQKSAGTL